MASVLVTFTVPSLKWPHYGLTAIPAAMLLVAQAPSPRWARAATGTTLALLAVAAALLLRLPVHRVPALALAGAALLFLARSGTAVQLRSLAFATLFGMTVAGAGVVPALVPYADPGPVARVLASLQERKVPLAHLGKYHAQYNFAGRLVAPIEVLDPPELASWVAAHPEGRVMTVERSRVPVGATGPEYQAPFRGAWLQLWRGEALLVARARLR
jgi:hypothetical protein